ncbi:hypothetical protein V1509DRAFT_594105 [Lipomyces kononenkoae]
MTTQKYLPLHEHDLCVDSSEKKAGHSQRQLSKLGYLAIAMLLSSLLAGLLGALIGMRGLRLGSNGLCDLPGYRSSRGPISPDGILKSGGSMQKRQLFDETLPQALINATAVAQELLGSILPTLMPDVDAESRNETLFADDESAAAGIPNITITVSKKSIAARALDNDVLETLGNATAVAANLLEVILPALIARTNISSVNGISDEPRATISDIVVPSIKTDLLTGASALGEEGLQTLLNATSIAGQLLGTVIPALVAYSDTKILNNTVVAAIDLKAGVPDVATSIVKRDLATSASGLVTSASSLGGDVLQTLANATAVAEQLLGAVIPALVARADVSLAASLH